MSNGTTPRPQKYASMYSPNVSAVAATVETDSRTVDAIDEKIRNAVMWPYDYPKDLKATGKSIRFRYRITNDSQADVHFTSILEFYRDHVMHEHKHCESSYPFLKEYLTKDPLGLVPVEFGDTRYYENASKLIANTADKAKPARKPRKKKGKRKQKTKEVSAPTPPPASASGDDMSAAEAASATRPPPAPEAPVDLTSEARETLPVLTKFAHLLKNMQAEIYLLLRANITSFMDSHCKQVMTGMVKKYERDNAVTGPARLAIGTRYSWSLFQSDMKEHCCQKATAGFYFLPLYTTLRKKDQAVVAWCQVIRSIMDKLGHRVNQQWTSMSERDAMWRLRLFLSKKDKEVVENDLQNNHVQLWLDSNKNLDEFFTTRSLNEAIDVLTSISAAKFPLKYDAEKHSPDAVEQCLFTFEAVKAAREEATKKVALLTASKDQEVRDLKKEVANLKQQLKNAGKRPPKRPRNGGNTGNGGNPKGPPGPAKPSTQPEPAGDNGKVPKPFPPPDKDRRFPRSEYPEDACSHCKREDVPPRWSTGHDANACPRRPNGECDQKNAKTKNQRDRVVRKLYRKKQNGNKGPKPGQKARRGQKKGQKHVKFKVTEMSVRQTGALSGANATPVTAISAVAPVAVTDLTGPTTDQVEVTDSPPYDPVTDTEEVEDWSTVTATPEAWRAVPKGQCPPTVLIPTEEGLVAQTVVTTAQAVAPSYASVLRGANATPVAPNKRGANATPVAPNKRKRSNKGRILRSKNYDKNTIAINNPVTETELKWACRKNHKACNPEHMRHMFDGIGHEHHLLELRKDYKAWLAKRANGESTSVDSSETSFSDESDSYTTDDSESDDSHHRRRRAKRKRKRKQRLKRKTRKRRKKRRGQSRSGQKSNAEGDKPTMAPITMAPATVTSTKRRVQTPNLTYEQVMASDVPMIIPNPNYGKSNGMGGIDTDKYAPNAAHMKNLSANLPKGRSQASKKRFQKRRRAAIARYDAQNAASATTSPAPSAPQRGTAPSASGQTGHTPFSVSDAPPGASSVSKATDANQASTQRQVSRPTAATPCTQTLPMVFHSPPPPVFAGAKPGPGRKYGSDDDDDDSQGVGLKDLPMGSWLPACSIVSPKISMPNTKQSPFKNHGTTLPSETKGSRLLQAFMQYRDPTGSLKVGRVKLDTQSNGCYSLPGISLPRKWRPWEAKFVKGITGVLTPLGDPLYLTVIKDGKPVQIDSNAPPPGALEDGCVALLGLDVIYNLGIDVAHAIKHEQHLPIKYLREADTLVEMRKLEAYAEYTQRGLTPSMLYKTTNLAERVVRQYLDEHPDDYVKKPISIGSVDISPDLPRQIRDMIIALLKQFEDVFASHTNTLPPELAGVEPHVFKMKEDYVHRMAPRPTFSPARAELINAWLDWALEVGLVEEATNTSYASRLILAGKRKSSTPKSSPPDGVRVAWAGVDINEGITKTVPTYTDAWQELYKVANLKYKFSADGLKQYWSIPLAKEAREVTAFWTPRGLFQFTRMVMGTKNAATVAQNAYTKAIHTLLHKRSFANLANFADDFLGGADTGESLVQVFGDFLLMCRKAKITLNPTKVRIGYEREQFFGLTVDKGKIEPAERNIDPVVNMEYPKNRSELRSVMGIFNQFSSFIKDYGRGNRPETILNSLASPKAEWLFTDRHREALDTLKRQVQERIHLYAPDNNHPLVLETDGSDDGWGAVLYQKIQGEKRIIKMWSKSWKTEAWHKKPPYHREAKAWMNGMTLALPYAMCNPYPLQCWTDHSPLTWVKHTSGKGPVSQFIIDTLSMIDYEMNYFQGKDNVIADGLSRFPMLGPQRLVRSGLANALDILLTALLDAKVDTTKIWFDARKDTKFLLPQIFDWCDARRKSLPDSHTPSKTCYQDSFSISKVTKLKYTLGIWAPPADKICRQVRAAIERATPFACLVPSDLIGRIGINEQGEISEEIRDKVAKAPKIAFLESNLTWLIFGIQIPGTYKQVYVNNRVTPEIELDMLMKHLRNSDLTPPLPTCRTRGDWIREQHRHHSALNWANNDRVFPVQDGLLVYQPTDEDTMRTIVPAPLQRPLIKWMHHNMCHMSAGKVYNVLKKRYHFHDMNKVCHQVVADCALCNLLKARMKHAHKHFRAKLSMTPRTSYGADYYGVNKNKLGYDNVLGIIDLATGHLVLRAVQGRNAPNTAHTLFYDVVVHKGVPLRFHSDAAQEFLSTAMSTLQNLLGIGKSDTLAHNPKSNAKIERVWEFVGRALRSMTPEQYEQFHLYMPILAHVWNCTPDSDTKVTPFEAEHGMPCRSVADSVMQNPPVEGLPASAADLTTVAVAAAAYNELISNIKAVERTRTAAKLNNYGQPLKEYRVGDRVAFYLPPDSKEARRMGKNPKHMLQYKGPAIISEALSNNNTAFELRCEQTGRKYRRNIMHISPYTATEHVPAELQVRVDNTVSTGTYVAVLDESNDTKYHIAKVLDVSELTTTIHYYGTKKRRLREAIWKPLYQHPRSNVVIMQTPDTIIRDHLQYIGRIDTRPRDDSLIILANVGMTDRNRINARSRRVLASKARYSHHRIASTWDPNHTP